MAFCNKCGKEIPDGAKFCPVCGAPCAGPEPRNEQEGPKAAPEGNINTENVQGQFSDYFKTEPEMVTNEEKADAENNKLMAVLSYLGILVLIPIFAAKESKFARFHANNGLILSIIELVIVFLRRIIRWIFPLKWHGSHYNRFFLYYPVNIILWIAGIAVVILMIIGIIHALKGNKKDLPVVGNIKIIK